MLCYNLVWLRAITRFTLITNSMPYFSIRFHRYGALYPFQSPSTINLHRQHSPHHAVIRWQQAACCWHCAKPLPVCVLMLNFTTPVHVGRIPAGWPAIKVAQVCFAPTLAKEWKSIWYLEEMEGGGDNSSLKPFLWELSESLFQSKCSVTGNERSLRVLWLFFSSFRELMLPASSASYKSLPVMCV